MRGWASHRCGWPSEGEDPSRGGWGWEHREGPGRGSTWKLLCARGPPQSRGTETEPGGGTAGQIFHPLPSAHHLGLAIPASRTGYEEAPQWSLSGLSVSQKTPVPLSRKWNKVLWKWINAASIPSFRNGFQVKKLPCLLPVLITYEHGGPTEQWWENNHRTEASWCVLPGAPFYHCYSPQLLGRFYIKLGIRI